MRTFKALSLILLCGLAAAAPSQAHFSARKATWGSVRIKGHSQFPLYHRLGVGIYEIQLRWDVVAPKRPKHPRSASDPAYDWPSELSDAIGQARRYHIRVMVQLIGAPSWSNGRKPSNFAPKNPRDFASFAAAASHRYPTVHLWMIWGEPSREARFAPEPAALPNRRLTRRQAAAPRLYARILDAAYGSLKGASGRNLVIGGCTFATGNIYTDQWIDNLKLPNGRPPRMDLYGHNPFSARIPNLRSPPEAPGAVDFSDLGRLAKHIDRSLSRWRGQHIPLFLSEFTIPTAPDGEFNFWVDRGTQAKWIRAAFKIVHRWSRIYALGWVNIFDEPPRTFGGLLDVKHRPKPGYYAFQQG